MPEALACAAQIVPGLGERGVECNRFVEAGFGIGIAALFLAYVAQPVPGARRR